MADLRPMLARLIAWERMEVVPPLEIHRTSNGLWVAIDDDRIEFVATLSGSGPAYSWGATEFPKSGGLGTGNPAYALNGETGLSGKKVWIRRSAVGDYRFEWNRFGYCHKTFCVVLTGLLDDAPVEGATVEMLDGPFGGTVLATATTDADGRACITPYPSGANSVRISVDTGHGTASALFRFLGGSCDIEQEYTVCYGYACLDVTDGTEGGPLSGADVAFVVNCANDTFRSPSFSYGPVTESPPGTYCGLAWRIQPKSRTCTAPITIGVAVSKGNCYYGDASYPFPCGGETPCGVTGTFACADWSGSITLSHFQPKLRVLIAAQCGAANVTIDVAGVTTETVLVPGDFPANGSGSAGVYHEVDITVPWPFAESYDVTVTPTTPGYLVSSPSTQTVAFDCRNGGSASFNLTLDDLYTCGCCGFPVKKVLHFSDPYGSCVWTWTAFDSFRGGPGWVGSYTYAPTAPHEVVNVYGSLVCVAASGGSVTVEVHGVCTGQGTNADGTHAEVWTVVKLFPVCQEPGPPTDPGFLCVSGSCGGARITGTGSRTCTDTGFSLDLNFAYGPLETQYNETAGAGNITE